MQLHALDHESKLVLASSAIRKHDYQCIECLERVRLRGGTHRQKHFYHLEPNPHCCLHGKGMVHLQIQFLLHNQIPDGECQLECRFPEINRIADVAWLKQKVIFEIQCSPISADEVRQRNEDYELLGLKVVWILHDNQYNKWRLSPAEEVLQNSSHYFTNVDGEGKGYFYDQFDFVLRGIRRFKMTPLPVNPVSLKPVRETNGIVSLSLVLKRLKTWRIGLEGDLMDLYEENPNEKYIVEALEIEKKHLEAENPKKSLRGFLGNVFYYLVIRPYFLFFQMLLEKSCK